jgi:hypothetical protein
MLKRKGHYFGTEINETWWKRYMKDKFFARGTGEYWYDSHAFRFRRYLTKAPIVLPFDNVIELKTGYWHAGRWGRRNPIIKFIWEKDGIRLSSGFLLSRHRGTTENMISEFRGYMNAVKN